MARTSCLATLPEFAATQEYRGEVIDKERLELSGRLAPPDSCRSRGRHPPSREEFCPSFQEVHAFSCHSLLQKSVGEACT